MSGSFTLSEGLCFVSPTLADWLVWFACFFKDNLKNLKRRCLKAAAEPSPHFG